MVVAAWCSAASSSTTPLGRVQILPAGDESSEWRNRAPWFFGTIHPPRIGALAAASTTGAVLHDLARERAEPPDRDLEPLDLLGLLEDPDREAARILAEFAAVDPPGGLDL